jgi:N-acetylmuramoyl-L-alanine amidase
MQSCDAALERLCDPAHEVSAHYLISEHGAVFALVEEGMRAWHAGAGRWGAVSDVNSRSIGIELANPGDAPFPSAQMRACEGLLRAVMARHHIAPARVIGHSDMAPGRKADPGGRFDWRRLALQRLSVWPTPPTRALNLGTVPLSDDAFLQSAAVFGYDPEQPFEAVLAAFRLRFRPGAAGSLDAADLVAIRDLAHRFPADRFPVDRAPVGA